MKRILALWVCLVLLLGMLVSLPTTASAGVNLADLELTPAIAVCSISTEETLRICGNVADLNDLEADEYYSYYLTLRYTGSKSLPVKSLYVRVDGGEKWSWGTSSLEPGSTYGFHVYYSNMKKLMSEGSHTVSWYINNEAICTTSFTFTSGMTWDSVFSVPSASQIASANQSATVRSPYLYGWLQIGNKTRYTEYSVDFKADFVPKATYCALANLKMDLSSLEKKYRNVHTEYSGVGMYAGFQRRWNEYVTIMSAWDVYYTDKNGVEHTLRPQRLYPATTSIGDGTFTGEGTGIQMLVPFDWEAGHWYRMLLQCSETDSGTTKVDQWICDLETGTWRLMSSFDTLIPDSCFIGNNAFFLENFDTDYAGEIRTMEVTNARIRDAKTGKWKAVTSALIGSNGGLPKYEGSYAYGSAGNRFWMITSGVGGDWFGTKKVPKNNQVYKVKGGEATSPY